MVLAVMLILVLNGFLDGMYRQITSYLDHSPGSVVVAQEDVVNLLGATSRLPGGIVSQVEAVRGVEEAIPILSQFVILDLHGKKQPTYMVGYDPDQGSGPRELSSGRQPRTKREMVFDRVLAGRHGLKLGDTVEVLGKDFTIVGLSNGTTSWMTSFFFIRKEAAEDLLLTPGATSYLLLTTSTGADVDDVLRRLNDLSGVNALAKGEMAANDLKLFAEVFSAPLKLMVGIAFLVGTMIVGLVIYTITVERQREYGVIKVFDPTDVGWALLAGLFMALVAALFPARLVAGLAPREDFAKQERQIVKDMSTDVITIMNLIGFLIGLAVMALTVYTATLARRAEYGVLKALGARNGHLYRAVLVQALLSVAFGFAIGLAVTFLLSAIVPRLGLSMVLEVSGASLLKVGGFSLVIAGMAAILPIRQIAGLDPAMVFRGMQ